MGLVFVGDTDFKLTNKPVWNTDQWELDRLIMSMQGGVDKLDAYLDSLESEMGTASDIDSNMFLTGYTQDKHPRWPTVELTYTGKKGGNLPPDRDELFTSEQQTSGITQEFEFIFIGGIFVSKQQGNLTYIAPTTRRTVWSRTPIDQTTLSAPEPPDIQAAQVVSLILNDLDYAFISGLDPDALAALIDQTLQNGFRQRTSEYPDSQEVVSGQYYRGVLTKQKKLYPILTQ